MEHMRGGERGHSLLEMIVAISVAAVVSGATFPVVTGLYRQYSLVSAANQLSFDIMRARMQAASQARFVRIRFYDSTRYAREQSADGLAFKLDGGIVSLPEGIVAESAQTGEPVFDPSGLGTAGSVIKLSGGDNVKTVTTNVLGRVTIS